MPNFADNPKAKFDYELLDKFEAGIVLEGHEVKSIRKGHMSLRGAYVTIARGRPTLVGAHITKYPQAGPLPGYDPARFRDLLIHKRELGKLVGKMEQTGLTLVPLSVYASGSKIKLSFALARGKKQFEKKETIKKRDLDREVQRELRE